MRTGCHGVAKAPPPPPISRDLAIHVAIVLQRETMLPRGGVILLRNVANRGIDLLM